MRKQHGGGNVEVFRITGARAGLQEDVRGRQRRYVISMSIRIVCFLLAAVTSGWVRWTLVACALVIPYIAVVYANGGREPTGDPPDTLRPVPGRELPGSSSRQPPAAA